MAYARTYILLQRVVELELDFCRQVNQSLRVPFLQGFFAAISRLGDGIFWYSLMACLPLVFGIEALGTSVLMAVVALVNLAAYKLIKRVTGRDRPCTTCNDIIPGARLLDHYSFPSGHTLHAVSFTIIAVTFFPILGWVLIPFTILVAMSRVILGLHYPTDVIAGALIGTAIATTGLYYFQA